MNELQKLTTHLEYLFLQSLIRGLRNKNIDIPEAKKYATAFLELEPLTSLEDAKVKINQLSQLYPKFSIPEDYIDLYYQEQQKDDLLEKMKQYIKENKIDEALNMVK